MAGMYEPRWFKTHKDGSISYSLPVEPPAKGTFSGCVEPDGTVRSWSANFECGGIKVDADSFGGEAGAEECRLVAYWAEAKGVKLPPLKPGRTREPDTEEAED